MLPHEDMLSRSGDRFMRLSLEIDENVPGILTLRIEPNINFYNIHPNERSEPRNNRLCLQRIVKNP